MDFNKLVEKLAEVSFYIRDVHYFSKEPGSFVQGIHTGTYKQRDKPLIIGLASF